MGFFSKLREGLGKAHAIFAPLLQSGPEKRSLTPEYWDELEEALLLADFGVPTTEKILHNLRVVSEQELWKTTDFVVERFISDVTSFMTLPSHELDLRSRPTVVLVVGVNGSGKTTSIGKLAARLRSSGKRVMVIAGDTFRAAAAEQLAVWAKRSGADFVRGQDNADPASVIHDGLVRAKSMSIDVVLIDTAGRLQNKTYLMEELKKIRRVIEREIGHPPDETLLVLDATIGQNAISQARLFHEATKLTGLIVTKLDSTAKGGVVIAVVDTIEIPIKFIGVGEQLDALEPFDPNAYVRALLETP